MEKKSRRELIGDVIVIGGGFAGIGAAIAAGRKGLTVYLVEASRKIGGVMSSCLGMPLGGGYPLNKNIGGIFQNFVERLYAMNPPAAEKRECSLHEFGPEVLYDYDIAVHTLFTMLEEAGVHMLLNTIAVEPEVKEHRIESLILCDKSGQFTVNAKIFLDCSGDGDISKKAGVPYTIGDDGGRMMGVTLTFLMKNASWDKIFLEGYDPYFRQYTKKGIEEGKIHEDLHKLYLMKGFHKDTVFFNSVVIKGVDATDQEEVTRATHEARKRCHDLKNFVKETIPGFENAIMVNTGAQVGVRETRKFEGMHYLTGEELAGAKKFQDGIVACNNPIDDVMRKSSSMTHDSIVEEGEYYTIPFRSLVPKKLQNLMFAGRIISADPTAFASLRGMPQCMQMGHAVGLSADMAIREGIKVQDIDRDLLVEGLKDEGLNLL
jgi:hypothetical protein